MCKNDALSKSQNTLKKPLQFLERMAGKTKTDDLKFVREKNDYLKKIQRIRLSEKIVK